MVGVTDLLGVGGKKSRSWAAIFDQRVSAMAGNFLFACHYARPKKMFFLVTLVHTWEKWQLDTPAKMRWSVPKLIVHLSNISKYSDAKKCIRELLWCGSSDAVPFPKILLLRKLATYPILPYPVWIFSSLECQVGIRPDSEMRSLAIAGCKTVHMQTTSVFTNMLFRVLKVHWGPNGLLRHY